MRTKLTDAQKDTVVKLYFAGDTHEEMALRFSVSRRTIGRVLQERGFLPQRRYASGEDIAMLATLARYRIETADELRRVLNSARKAAA